MCQYEFSQLLLLDIFSLTQPFSWQENNAIILSDYFVYVHYVEQQSSCILVKSHSSTQEKEPTIFHLF